MKRISILGSTGSIGLSTLQVIREHPEEFKVIGLGAGRNVEEILRQIEEFNPLIVSMATRDLAEEVKSRTTRNVKITYGKEGLIEVATHADADFVVSAMLGFAGLMPTIEAIKAGKDIGLANKETLVSAGHIIMDLVKQKQVRLLPIDSEHSAIFQAIQGERRSDVARIILTASGGALRHLKREELPKVSLQEALKHPNWKMGAKITIDSATMMNKALELIEAHWLFSLPFSHIDVIIHYESIIHSMVEFIDGAVIAQLGTPDMKVPIQYALSYPGRLSLSTERLSLEKIGKLHFMEMDFQRFPVMKLAYQVGNAKGTYPTAFNAANEVLVDLALQERLPIYMIEAGIEHVIQQHQSYADPDLEQILEADAIAREVAKNWAEQQTI
jgi:1-deoxy-D-xylulose-5-phosphate reductoisomerase